MIDTGSHLSALAADSQAFADLAEGGLDRAVPTCPDWKVADLVGHLGGVYSWVILAVEGGGERPARSRERAPEDPGALTGWFRGRRDAVIDALTSRPPEDPAWVFLKGGSTADVAWWRRRQAQETAIHLYDMESAVGTPGAIDPELAADGIDEILTVFVANYPGGRQAAGLDGTLHVHCTDAEGEWMLSFGPSGTEVRREHGKADTAVRGPASDLYLWLWNRVPLATESLEVFGRRSVAEAWTEVKL
ncbi:MAG TPA: maleylpyruvate isomerase family mycothiol-dependent enzyme [Acidimicrobiales bacterium]|jgi:uncharacterized protein (TIGR03083 family)|nr:maleylpyruvate isomerase family mycothiol-dependent enzyme [Acidimicrobiales bacterium]